MRVWAAGQRDGSSPGRLPGWLASVAAAIAIRAGESVTVEVPVSGGLAAIPTLGRMRVGDVPSAHVEIVGGEFRLHTDGKRRGPESPDWEPVRKLAAAGIDLLLDDVDPYRSCYSEPVRRRLTAGEFERWQALFDEAVALLWSEFPDQAFAVKDGLRVVTPLEGEPGRVLTARHAYGAIAMSDPGEARTLAMLMVSGLRAGQLQAVQAMCDLTGRDPAITDRLRLAYGRLAVLDFLSPWDVEAALREVADFVQEVAGRPLPDAGRVFVEGMRVAAAARASVSGVAASDLDTRLG